MHAPEVRPILRPLRQLVPHRVLAHVLPLLRVTLAIAQPMMKPATLKRADIRVPLRESIFPKGNPSFDFEPEIMWRAKQVQMVWHEEVVAHQPRLRRVFPYVVQRTLNGRLCQPSLSVLRANREEHPVRTAQGNVNPFAGVRLPGSRGGTSGCSGMKQLIAKPLIYGSRFVASRREKWDAQQRVPTAFVAVAPEKSCSARECRHPCGPGCRRHRRSWE